MAFWKIFLKHSTLRFFIAVLNTATFTGNPGGCRLSIRWNCRARYGDQCNTLYCHKFQVSVPALKEASLPSLSWWRVHFTYKVRIPYNTATGKIRNKWVLANEPQYSPLVQINHQPDATIFQFFLILTFIYSSTCFGSFPAHHQELMMGGKTPETRWAVNKRQDKKLKNCCIWLVIYLNCTMMQGLTNLKIHL